MTESNVEQKPKSPKEYSDRAQLRSNPSKSNAVVAYCALYYSAGEYTVSLLSCLYSFNTVYSNYSYLPHQLKSSLYTYKCICSEGGV